MLKKYASELTIGVKGHYLTCPGAHQTGLLQQNRSRFKTDPHRTPLETGEGRAIVDADSERTLCGEKANSFDDCYVNTGFDFNSFPEPMFSHRK